MIQAGCSRELPLSVGVVRAEGVEPGVYPPGFRERLDLALGRRAADASASDEAVRAAARDMLRHGRYKPTGRGKPASEYLVRAAVEGTFPRINGVVDVCNLVSLESLLPISLWDLDKARAKRFTVRRGVAGEAYVFNAAGQVIELEDLVVGCRLPAADDEAGEPIVNPVKDCLATKTDDGTRRVAALVYAPAGFDPARLEAVLDGFAALLAGCGAAVSTAWGVVGPGSVLEV